MVDLGTLPGGTASYSTDVSDDGSVVVGTCYAPAGPRAFRWTLAGGMVDLGLPLDGGGDQEAYSTYGTAVSGDGAVVAGFSDPVNDAFRWTGAGGMFSLGTLGVGYSIARGCNSDGTVVVGESTAGPGDHAFRWTLQGGLEDLGTLPEGTISRAAVARNGGSEHVPPLSPPRPGGLDPDRRQWRQRRWPDDRRHGNAQWTDRGVGGAIVLPRVAAAPAPAASSGDTAASRRSRGSFGPAAAVPVIASGPRVDHERPPSLLSVYAIFDVPEKIANMANEDLASRERMTDLLASWVEGDARSGDRLFTALYQELRRLARNQLRGRPAGGTLDTTGLIHEAYLRLVDGSRIRIRDRDHFLALSSRVMRQIVVDYARRKNAGKRGAGVLRSMPGDVPAPSVMDAEDLLALNEALDTLETMEPRVARMVELRYFGGFSMAEIAKALEVSIETVKRDWLRARAFLYGRMRLAPPS